MSTNGSVNDLVVDAVDRSQQETVGASAESTLAMLESVAAETIGLALHNAVTTQHNMQMVSNAAVTAACARMVNTTTAPVINVTPKVPTPTPAPPPAAPSAPPAPAPTPDTGS